MNIDLLHPDGKLLSVSVQRLGDRARVLGGLSYVLGYAHAALRRAPRAEEAVRRAVRDDSLRRLLPRATLRSNRPRPEELV
jgi:hypothetical protein